MKRALILLLLLSCTTPTAIFDDVSFDLEFARSDYERSKGLMLRESMPDSHGMLFIFTEEKARTFWMKNTLIPLDIIFLDKDFTVVKIQNAVPCKEDPCAKYPSIKPAKFVLEINGGLAEKYNIVPGSKMVLRE